MNSKEIIDDPAEYLFQKTKYHDCHLTVGDPATDEVETIGVVTSNLVAHSTVFREMLVDSEMADPSGSNTHITDVSPAVFKLLLKHVYGACLPKINRETAAQLTLCADKYNIPPLVAKASSLLVPEIVEHVFPALRCVVYISLPNLMPHVTKIIQEQTDKVVHSGEFLELDENCLEFITKQDVLAITELELWRHLVKWVNKQTDKQSEMRQLLRKPLKHVRFLTLHQDDIVKEIINTKILSPVEVVELLSALSSNGNCACPELCSSRNNRILFRDIEKANNSSALTDGKSPLLSCAVAYTEKFKVFTSEQCNFSELPEYQSSSNFNIKIKDYEVALKSFKIKSKSFKIKSKSFKNNDNIYNFKCTITVTQFVNGLVVKSSLPESNVIVMEGRAVCGEDIDIPLVLRNGELLRLQPKTSYNVCLQFNTPHPAFATNITKQDGTIKGFTTYTERVFQFMSFKFNNPIQVREISYNY